ncbi:MAG TPA: hypothetical protein VGF84_18055 [Micromonosporaceae bacterium]
MDLFRQAAAHAAGGLGATVGPHLGSAKSTAKDKTASARGMVGPTADRVTSAASHSWDSTLAAFAPLAEAARQGSDHGTKLRAKDLSQKNKNNKSIKDTKRAKDQASWMAFTSAKSEPEPTSHTGLYLLLATGAAVGAAGALVARRRTRTHWNEYEPASIQSDASSFADAGATSKSMPGADGDADAGGTVSKAANWTKGHAKSAADGLRHKIHEATADRDDTNGKGKNGTTEAAQAKEKVNEGASHLSDKADARMNMSGTDKRTGDRIDDEVDDLLRSAKNGRM